MMIITIGKAQDNDYVVDDAHVSRHHARLVHGEDGFWMLEDSDPRTELMSTERK